MFDFRVPFSLYIFLFLIHWILKLFCNSYMHLLTMMHVIKNVKFLSMAHCKSAYFYLLNELNHVEINQHEMNECMNE